MVDSIQDRIKKTQQEIVEAELILHEAGFAFSIVPKVIPKSVVPEITDWQH